ncbi:MAG: hypothetical protein ABJB10_16320 [Mesorhizobium sp.]
MRKRLHRPQANGLLFWNKSSDPEVVKRSGFPSIPIDQQKARHGSSVAGFFSWLTMRLAVTGHPAHPAQALRIRQGLPTAIDRIQTAPWKSGPFVFLLGSLISWPERVKLVQAPVRAQAPGLREPLEPEQVLLAQELPARLASSAQQGRVPELLCWRQAPGQALPDVRHFLRKQNKRQLRG